MTQSLVSATLHARKLEALRAQREQQAASEPEDEEELSEFERLVRDNRNNSEALNDIKNMLEERDRVQALAGQIKEAQVYQASQEEEFVKVVPDYRERMDKARQLGRSALIQRGYTAEQADGEIRAAEARIAMAAKHYGANTAEVLLKFAVSQGLSDPYEAQEAAPGSTPAGTASDDPRPTKAPSRRTTSLEDLGGRAASSTPSEATDLLQRMTGKELADLEENDPEKFQRLLLESMKE